MARYFPVDLDFEQWTGEQPVFREKTTSPFTVDEIRQYGQAQGSERQTHFETQLARMSEASSDGRVPVFSQWRDRRKRRMDLGCLGHALARGFIQPPENDSFVGYVTHVRLSREAPE